MNLRRAYSPSIWIATVLLMDRLFLGLFGRNDVPGLVVLFWIIVEAPMIGILKALPWRAPWGGPWGIENEGGPISFLPAPPTLQGWLFASAVILAIVLIANTFAVILISILRALRRTGNDPNSIDH